MATKHTEATRYYSNNQEAKISKEIGATRTPNSCAGKFRKGDLIHKEASLLVEAKCCMSDKSSFSIKKDWIVKNKDETFSQGLSNGCIAFDFGPGQEIYYVINTRLMKYLIEKLSEEE